MKSPNDPGELTELSDLFERTTEEAEGAQLTRMSAKAQEIPLAAGRWSAFRRWAPLSGVAVAAGVAGAVLFFGERMPGREPETASAARAPDSKVPVSFVTEPSDRQAAGQENVEDPSGEESTDMGGLEGEPSLDGLEADPGVLVVEEVSEESEGLRAFGSGDLFGPVADTDVDQWLVATNELVGGEQ